MKIAILGWGSLFWKHDIDFNKNRTKWFFDGPVLPLQFSRVSKTDDDALTLVIDPIYGDLAKVAFSLSKRKTVEEAITDLAKREGCSHRHIGRWPRGKFFSEEEIKNWAESKQIDHVIWTGLKSNFRRETGNKFSKPNIIRYLDQLSDPKKAEAYRYAMLSPKFLDDSVNSTKNIILTHLKDFKDGSQTNY